ncbi:hypothetical protein E8L90_12665 [Brevibacillus antibioticus]|uniref:Uncharacterized protein n=1 Tax=Brevibacillus antibioticus TaxID=2570228 RepID=A0A4U2Y6L8_9BACL|nr:hypothetical protein E8L90_12665 [Brevibacillus antibioticus]
MWHHVPFPPYNDDFWIPFSIKVKKPAFQHRESGENLKKEERSVGDLHEHRTPKVNASFDVESTFITTS